MAFAMAEPIVIFDFNTSSSLRSWMVVDDGVMGGRSEGNLSMSKDGHAIYYGDVSLENNGGFSSLRHRFSTMELEGQSQLYIRLKGDGKQYQVRLKTDARDYYSYINYFETTGEWQEVIIDLNTLYPSFRGRRLRGQNYPAEYLSEIGFLIGNKKAESFELLIDKIELR